MSTIGQTVKQQNIENKIPPHKKQTKEKHNCMDTSSDRQRRLNTRLPWHG